MAVEKPIAMLVREKLDRSSTHRRHVDGVFHRSMAVTITVDDSEKMAVQMHRVMHHCVVDKFQTQNFTT
jgi:hypothetical protein